MKVVGIVAEYNPFHNGHLYQMNEIRRQLDADYIIVIMSGNFTQRGEAAILNKFLRTEAALLGGADLVLNFLSLAQLPAQNCLLYPRLPIWMPQGGGYSVLWDGNPNIRLLPGFQRSFF